MKLMSTVIAAIGFAPSAVWAASIMETSSLTIDETTLDEGSNYFFTTAFAEFDPSLGTLTGVTTDLTGSATWMSNSTAFPLLALALETARDGSLTGGESFFTPGTISVSLLGGANPNQLELFTATGTTTLALLAYPNERGDTFATIGSLTGSITYTYTPAVPEPATWAMALTGFAGLGVLARMRRRKLTAA
jgi:hypothetical protein